MLTFLLDLFGTTFFNLAIILSVILVASLIETVYGAYTCMSIIFVACFIFSAWSLRKKYKVEKAEVNND